jgi:hypothetical protein
MLYRYPNALRRHFRCVAPYGHWWLESITVSADYILARIAMDCDTARGF